MKPSELQEKTCHQFDCAIKTVIRHRAIDFYRAIRRSEKKEMPFAEIMDDLLNSIGTEDTYSTDYVAVFEVCGEKVSIEDEQLARALKAIEERKRNIVLQYFFIGDTDTYIGKMLDCSRANVTKCRIQALDKLKQLIEEEKKMPKELTPTFTVISKACDGDETAISKILEFYDPYINQCCMRPFYDDNNNLRLAVDLEMKGFIKEAIIRKILNFDIKRF